MIMAMDENGIEITTAEAVKGGRYFCPVCGSVVTFKKGTVKMPHFSHHHIASCARYLYKKESPEHLSIKHELYLALISGAPVAMEYYLSEIEQIPDLLVHNHLALEIQLSRISPTLIVERTKGYRSIGKDVVWILAEGDMKYDDDYCRLTHFQVSAMKDGKITTYDLDTGTLYHYTLTHSLGAGRWKYVRHAVPPEEIITVQVKPEYAPHALTQSEVDVLVRRERQQKSVMNPTLSYMYQLGLTAKTLPAHLLYVTGSEHFIINNPLEWKLYLMYHLTRKSFNMAQFSDFISIRVMMDVPPRRELIRDLLNDYIMLYNSQ